VPEGLPAEIAAPLCCAGWTAYHALEEVALTEGQSVALFGYGGLGHLALQMARHRGLRVSVSDPAEAKRQQARDDGAELDARGVDAAIVLTAAAAAIPQAFRSLKRGGTLVLVGLSVTSYELPLVDTVLKGITVKGSYLGSRDDLAAVFRLAAEGILRPHVHTHGLADAPELIEGLRRGELAGRAVVRW
jgi:propanol-preferring alcohol dehydrogenase